MISCRLLSAVVLSLSCSAAQGETESLPRTLTPSGAPSQSPISLATTLAPAGVISPATDGIVTSTMVEYVSFLVTTDPKNVSNTDHHFVVHITDLFEIATARGDLIKTEGFSIIAGTIIKEKVPWNPKWSFYLDPNTITFGNMFSDVCDANVDDVEEHLAMTGKYFLPGNFWCPWSARILQELEEVISDDPLQTLQPPLFHDTPSLADRCRALEPGTYVDFLATANRADVTDTDHHFVVRITDLSVIDMAREEVALTDGWAMVSGMVIYEMVDWNLPWFFYLAPNSIVLSHSLPESCDASIDDVELRLDHAGSATFLPDLKWCPWSSRLLREIKAKPLLAVSSHIRAGSSQ